jgi:hypothetical protein
LAGAVISPRGPPVPSSGMPLMARPENPLSFSFSTPMAITMS